jgi:hypothetical protein
VIHRKRALVRARLGNKIPICGQFSTKAKELEPATSGVTGVMKQFRRPSASRLNRAPMRLQARKRDFPLEDLSPGFGRRFQRVSMDFEKRLIFAVMKLTLSPADGRGLSNAY